MNGESSYRRFLEGDDSAIDLLVRQYNKSLVFFLNGILKNISAAEDAAADTFVQLLVKKPRLKEDSAFRAYLFRIGRNRALDILRKQRRQGETVLDDAREIEDTLSLEKQILINERDKALHAALGELKDEYRDVLHLLYFEEMDYKSAATAMNKNVKQITNLAYRARAALKTVLQEKGFEYEN